MTTGPFFIEFEAFQHKEDFIIKELCIMEFHRPLTPLCYLFTPPFNYKNVDDAMRKSFKWQTKNHHHLTWDEGNRIFCNSCVMRHIEEVFPAWDLGIFYVMENIVNGQKLKILKKLFPALNIVNYSINFNDLPIVTENITCFYRNHGDHCAYLKCMRMLQHYADSKYS